MYVKNTSNKNIDLKSFEGYKFSIPTGTSWIWDKAGEHLLTNIFRIETIKTPNNKDRYGFDNGFGIPALLSGNEQDWLKGRKQLAHVERYQVSGKHVPRKNLLKVAFKYGISKERYNEYLADDEIDVLTIAEEINALPVPEDIRFPNNLITGIVTEPLTTSVNV